MSARQSHKDNFSSKVAEHYNQVEQKDIKERRKSDIIALRCFNNAMKSLMHQIAMRTLNIGLGRTGEPLRVLDLGCGKGGDLPKYIRNNQIGLVVGADIADVSIEQCKERFKKAVIPHSRRFRGEFFVADLTRDVIRKKILALSISDKFNIASSQFSIHYSFESFDQAIRYIYNAAENLERLGVFIGTYPDGPKLLKLARNSETPGIYQVDDVLKVEFPPESLENPKPFGTKYHFHLKEVVDCPEFLVHPLVLKKLMTKLGFIQVFDRSFEETISEERSKHWKAFSQIFEAHKALRFGPGDARLDKATWQTASIYRCFCYRKV